MKPISITISNEEPRCPICHSNVIKFQKVHSGGKWYHRCISGHDHGIIVLPDGEEIDIGVTYDKLYFTSEGEFTYQVTPEREIRGKVERQEMV